MPPKVIAKNDRPSGVLPVSAAARTQPNKSPATRLKLEVRRLPPSLTLTEFETTLGDEWKLGNGKVDWREYRQGKVKAPGKIPEQSRCYLHVVSEAAVRDFEQTFLSCVFQDKAGTHKSTDIKHLPPTLGFALSQRTPLQVKQRMDSRQGTIDQDSDFIAFLESETQPITKPAVDILRADKEREIIKTTPLIADLREKKAQRAKAAAEKLEKKKVDEKKGPHARGDSKDAVVPAEKDGKAQKVRLAAKEAAKVLNKQAAAKQQQEAVKATANAKTASPTQSKKVTQSPRQQNATPVQPTPSPGPGSPAPERRPPGQRQRGNADGIKKMLQKDLGIRPKNTPPASTAPATAPSPAPNVQPPATTTPAVKPSTTSKPPPTPAATSTKAYLKHANPSQGMTEMLILRALAEYGEVSNVTIDPRKGTAIAVFKDNEGLKKAMEARRVTVASGAVEVLEFRDAGTRGPGAAPAGGGGRGRGGFRGGRGGRGGAAAGSVGTVSTPSPGPPAA